MFYCPLDNEPKSPHTVLFQVFEPIAISTDLIQHDKESYAGILFTVVSAGGWVLPYLQTKLGNASIEGTCRLVTVCMLCFIIVVVVVCEIFPTVSVYDILLLFVQTGNHLHAFFFYYFCCCWCLCHFSHRSWMLLFVLETNCMLSSKSCSCAIVAVKASDCCFSPALDYIAILAPLLSGFLERPVARREPNHWVMCFSAFRGEGLSCNNWWRQQLPQGFQVCLQFTAPHYKRISPAVYCVSGSFSLGLFHVFC